MSLFFSLSDNDHSYSELCTQSCMGLGPFRVRRNVHIMSWNEVGLYLHKSVLVFVLWCGVPGLFCMRVAGRMSCRVCCVVACA